MNEKQKQPLTTLSQQRAAQLKAGGFIPQCQKGQITVRCKGIGGRITSDRLRAVAEAADKYGTGLCHLSVRQSIEILNVPLERIDELASELSARGQPIASCGKRVRVPTACGGCEWNPNGWTDTQRIAEEIDKKYFGIDTYHKFKIAVTGCAIDCMRTREMDLGFQGAVEPELVPEKCPACELCVRACEDYALKMENDLPVRNWDNCISCGDCIKACPFDAMVSEKIGHIVNVGGRHGKHPHAAYPFLEFVPDDKVFTVIDTVLDWYKANGNQGERIGLTLDRVGIESLREKFKEFGLGEYLISLEDLKKRKWKAIYWTSPLHKFWEKLTDKVQP